MTFNLDPYKIAAGTKPYKIQFDSLVDQIQLALNTNLGDIEDLQSQVGGNANDNIGDLRISSATLSAAKYLGPIPYPDGLTDLSKETYSDLYATSGFSGTDSALWSAETSGITADLRAVTHNGTNYVAVGTGGTAILSTDGETWSSIGTPPASTVNRITASTTSPLVVVGVGQGNFISRSADGGATFTTISPPAALTAGGYSWDIRDVKNYAGVFYACGYRVEGAAYYSMFMYSADGLTWTVTTTSIPGAMNAVTYDGSTYAMMTGTSTIRSTDFITWTQKDAPSVVLYDIIHVSGLWVVCGFGGVIKYSTDNGDSWPSIDSGTTAKLNFARYDSTNLQFVFGGELTNSQTIIYTWQNGEPTATPQNTGATVVLNDYSDNGSGQSVIIGNGGSIYTFSAYGGDFSVLDTADITGNVANIHYLSVAGSNLLAVYGASSNAYVYQSTDSGSTWTLQNTFATAITTPEDAFIAYDSANSLYIVGIGAFSVSDVDIYYSATIDGTFTRSLLDPAFSGRLDSSMAIDPSNGITIALNTTPKLYRTTDGINWSSYTPPFASYHINIGFYNGYFVVCNAAGTIYYSATAEDGTWSSATPPGSSGFCAVSYLAETGEWFFINSSSSNIWKTTDITDWSAAAITADTTFDASYGLTSVNGVLLAGATGGTRYSFDGLTWVLLDATSPGRGLKNSVNSFATGLPFSSESSDDFTLFDYSANTIPNTFDVTWPSQFAAPSSNYGVYIKWAD